MFDLKCKKCSKVIQKNVTSYKGDLFCPKCKAVEKRNIISNNDFYGVEKWQMTNQ